MDLPAAEEVLQAQQSLMADSGQVSDPVYMPVARDGEIIDSAGGGAIDAILPVVKTESGMSYITGGIGEEEMTALKEAAPNFNVRVLLASADGAYMGDAIIRFLDKNDAEILRVHDVGPYFYINLPAGKYRVEAASAGGEVQGKNINAPAKASKTGKIVLRFK